MGIGSFHPVSTLSRGKSDAIQEENLKLNKISFLNVAERVR